MKAIAAVCTITAFAATAVQLQPAQPDLFSAGDNFVNAWADFDGDGDIDLFVGFNGKPNRLYRNDRGVFTEVAGEAGIADPRPTRASAWGDFDGDGDPDLLVGFAPGNDAVLKLYRNDSGRFIDHSAVLSFSSNSGAVRQPSWIDFDGDHDLDLFVAFRDRPNILLRNDGGQFTDVAPSIGLADPRKTVGAVWFDLDEDGDLDLYSGNMDGDANGLFQNTNGRFRDVASEAGVAWGGRAPGDPQNGTVRTCAADVNNDGRLDLFAANYGKNGLFLSHGGGRFEDVSGAWGIAVDSRYDSCAFADFDNDGRLDLYVNGTVTGGRSYRDHLFHNTGNRFEDVTPANLEALQADHGVQWADFDRDGGIDLALTGSQSSGMHSLLRNILPSAVAARSLHVRVIDERGRSIFPGAEIRLFAAGTRTLLGLNLIDSGSGYDSQNDMPVHFGLPSMATVDIEVTIPVAGKRQACVSRKVDPGRWRGRTFDVRCRN